VCFLNALDVIVIILIAALVAANVNRGFLLTVYGFVSFAASIAAARALFAPVSGWLRGTGFYAGLTDWLRGAMFPPVADGGEYAAASIKLSGAAKAVIPEISALSAAGGAAAGAAAAFAAASLLNVICGAVVFGAVLALTQIAGRLLGFVNRIPVIGTANRLAGGALGALEGVFISALIISVLAWLPGDKTTALVGNSLAARTLTPFISGFIKFFAARA
jgi:uncharacterized membrane protein required for colicin V production